MPKINLHQTKRNDEVVFHEAANWILHLPVSQERQFVNLLVKASDVRESLFVSDYNFSDQSHDPCD